MIFFIKTFTPMMIRKLIPAAYTIEMLSKETLIARTKEARRIMKISLVISFMFMIW